MKLPNWLYDILKWLCILGLPTLSTLYATIAGIWGLPFADKDSADDFRRWTGYRRVYRRIVGEL